MCDTITKWLSNQAVPYLAGCSRLLEIERRALYPPQTATLELNSPPVRHSNIAVSRQEYSCHITVTFTFTCHMYQVTVACNEGYAQTVSDGGKATISCNSLVGWDSSPDQLIKCLRES